MIIKGYIFSILYVLACLVISLVLYKLGVPKKFTRKVVHILVGFEWVILYRYMGAGSVHFLAVCLLFLLLLFIEYKAALMPMMSSDGENAPGTVYYALAMSVMALVTMFVPNMIYPFGIAVFCTSFGDGLAGIFGQGIRRFNFKIWNEKTVIGGVVNLIVCFAAPMIFSEIFSLKIPVWQCILIAVLAFELELFSEKGMDNIAITLGVGALAYFLMFVPQTVDYIVPIMLTPAVVAIVLKKDILTNGAVAAALLLDIAVSVAFGNFGFIILAIFLFGSVLSDKFKKRHDKAEQKSEIASERRTSLQVFANGFAGMLCALLYVALDNRAFLVAFVAVFAEALSDTAASGLGSASKATYDIFRFKKCDNGLSGGMSILGTSASLACSVAVAAVALLLEEVILTEAVIIAVVSFAGAVFDSFMGSIFQVKYKCAVCGKITEKSEHCGTTPARYRGIPFITNGTVNFLSTVFAAVLAVVLCNVI